MNMGCSCHRKHKTLIQRWFNAGAPYATLVQQYIYAGYYVAKALYMKQPLNR